MYVSVAVVAVFVVFVVVMISNAEDPDLLPLPVVPSKKIRVFATFFPYYEFARNVAGDMATVEQFVPTGVLAHDWEPQPGRILSLQEADVFVYNGLGIEPYAKSIIDSDEFDHVMFVKASEGVKLLKVGDEEEEEEDEHGHDPHIWLDPVLAKQQVNNIRDGLILADPAGEEVYRLNAIAYNAELDGFDRYVRDELSECQLDTFVLFHNTFAYFVHQYDLRVFALGEASPESEVTAAEIMELIAFVRDNDIGVVFAEDLIDPHLAEVIADEAGAQVMILNTLEALTSQEASENTTYLEKMAENLEALERALKCA